MPDATELTAITANVMQIIANAGWVVVAVGFMLGMFRRGWAFVNAIIVLASLKDQLPQVVQGYETMQKDFAEIKRGVAEIGEKQDKQEIELKQLKADLGDLRRKQLGHGSTHVNIKPPRQPPEGLTYDDEADIQ